MPIPWCDSADYYDNTSLLKIWDNGSGLFGQGGGGRYGGGNLGIFDHGSITKFLRYSWLSAYQPDSFAIVGDTVNYWMNFSGWVRLTSYGNTPFFALISGSQYLGGLGVDQLGRFVAYDEHNAVQTVFGTSACQWLPGVGFHFEISAKSIYVATGLTVSIQVTYQIRINGTDVGGFGLAASMASGITKQITEFGLTFGGGGQFANLDDACLIVHTQADIVAEGTPLGPLINHWYGDIHVECKMPSADGAHTDFSPSTFGAHWLMVKEIPPDNDSTYVGTNNAGDKDTYKFTAHDPNQVPDPTRSTIYGVQHTFFARASFVGAAVGGSLCRPTTTDFEIDAALPPVWNRPLQFMRNDNPDTAAPWTPTEVFNAEFGTQLTST